MIWIQDAHDAIGAGGRLPFVHEKALELMYEKTRDLKNVIMGRKTYDVICATRRSIDVLPGLYKFVLSRKHDDGGVSRQDVEFARSFEEIERIHDFENSREKHLMVIGGGEVFSHLLTRASRLRITGVFNRFNDRNATAPDFKVLTSTTTAEQIKSGEFFFKESSFVLRPKGSPTMVHEVWCNAKHMPGKNEKELQK